jgi:hypothetical protein
MTDRASYPIEQALDCEVLVIGAGLAGVCAAVEAGRLGCDVVLVEKDAVLGGNSSPDLGVHISGAHSFHAYASETGLVGEIEEEAAYRRAKLHTHGHHYNIARQWDSLLHDFLRRAGVPVLKRHLAKEPVVEGNRIAAVFVEDCATFVTKRINVGRLVIEASGDGHVAARAGAEFRIGREARPEFGERSAPERADDITMGTSITALVRKASHPVPFVPPPGTPKHDGGADCLYSHASWDHRAELCFMWVTETGGQLDTIRDDHEIHEELLRQFYSVWDHIKHGPHAEQARNWELVWVSPKAGKRESRRFVGDYMLTQADIEEARLFEDRAAYGGYALDIHDPVGTRAKVVFHCIPPLFSIPYRCLYSRNIANLMLAGRLMSVTHLALGAVRLMKTLATAGQAVGAAAYLCRKHDCLPRDLYPERIGELQQLLLRRDATILDLRSEDTDDLARGAKVSATSEAVFECAETAGFLPLDMARGIMLWNWPKRLERLELYARSKSDAARRLALSVSAFVPERRWKAPQEDLPYAGPGPANRMEWGNDNTIARFAPLGAASAEIAPRSEGWVEFEFSPPLELPPKDETSDEGRCAVIIAPAAGVGIALHCRAADFAQRCEAREADAAFATAAEPLCFRIHPRPIHGEAANAVNGLNRRFCTNPVNMWMSAPGEPLPQSLALEWPEPVRFRRVHLAFDTLYRSYHSMPFNCGGTVSEMCAQDYSLEAFADGEWRVLVEERGNYRRFRVHEFPAVTTSRLRLTIRAANGEGYGARVYEVRMYA